MDALLGLAFSQAINSLRSFAGIVFRAKRTNADVTSGAYAKTRCVDLLPFKPIWQLSCATKKASGFSSRPNCCVNERLRNILNVLRFSLSVCFGKILR